MVLPFLTAAAPLVSAGSSLFGSIMGAQQGNAAAQAQQESNRVALLNWLQNRRAADFQQDMATAPVVNARGDVTQYRPGVGWTTTPSAFTRGMQTNADNEATAGFAVDQPAARFEQRNASRRRIEAGSDADAARAGRFVGRQGLPEVEGLMIEEAVADADSGADALRNAVGMTALRTGSGGEVALANAARNAIADRRTGIARARLNAGPEAMSRRGAQTGVAENAMGAASRRAAGTPSVRLAGGDFGDLNRMSPAQAEIASRMLARGGQVDAPRLGYADDRTGIGIASIGGAADRFLTELGQFGRTRGTKQPSKPQAHMLEGMF